MFSDVILAPEIEDFLRGLTVPVRVLNGNALRLDPSPNWDGHVRASGATRAECMTNGLTVVSWGSDHSAELTYVDYLSGGAYADGEARYVSREFVGDELLNEQSYRPFTDTSRATATLARMNPDRRIVWFNFPLTSFADGGLDLANVDLYTILGEPITRVLGADRLPRVTERARTLFMTSATQARRGPIARIERQRDQQRANVESFAENIRTAYSELRRLDSELAVQRRVTTVCQARLAERWDALVAHPKLTRISDNGTALVLTTVPLDIENPNTGDTCYLGIIAITLRHGGNGLYLTFTNVDNARGDGDLWAHPHCAQNTQPCWGGSEVLAADLLASHDLPAILEFALQFLGSYNPSDSWGSSHAPWWFTGDYSEDENEDDDCMCSECTAARDAA